MRSKDPPVRSMRKVPMQPPISGLSSRKEEDNRWHRVGYDGGSYSIVPEVQRGSPETVLER